MLGVEATADVDTIKKAFRREIARYHPDKVTHLGPEFQAMASTRAAELTHAYKTLSDPSTREEYDAALRSSGVAPVAPPRPADAQANYQSVAEPPPSAEPAAAQAPNRRFEQERAGRDEIMRRAVMARVRAVLAQFVGDCEMPNVRGFDLACLSKARPSLFRRTVPPSVLVRMTAMVDAQAAADAWSDAVKARLAQKPIVLLLIGNGLAPAGELGRAIEEQRRRFPAMADTIFPVPVDIRDWSAKVPANAPDNVRLLIDKLKNFVA